MLDGKDHDQPAVYRIRVKGVLDPSWSDWFDHFRIYARNDETILKGPVADQGALLGILTKINDLGLMIMTVMRVG
jgi:hypothetical protein